MSEFELKVTSVSDGGDDFIEADLVKFEVIVGEPEEHDVCKFLESFSTSACNISYNTKTKSGRLTDLNFEYEVGQTVSTAIAEHFYS